jgi:hypothetical protein
MRLVVLASAALQLTCAFTDFAHALIISSSYSVLRACKQVEGNLAFSASNAKEMLVSEIALSCSAVVVCFFANNLTFSEVFKHAGVLAKMHAWDGASFFFTREK